MPIYVYKCPVCGATEERMVPLKDADRQMCGKHADVALLKRQLTTASFTIKGLLR